MNITDIVRAWLRRNRFATSGLLLCLGTVEIPLWQSLQQPPLQPAAVDRLRMAAESGRDPAALTSLQQAARQGNIDAQRAAAGILIGTKDTAQSATGVKWAKTAAERGDAGAQYLLGKVLFDGNTALLRNRQQARFWFEQAASQQHAQATYFLGLIYKNGYGVAINAVSAASWFDKSAALGNADAIFMLGTAYMEGSGVPANQARAVALFRQAAELEHPLAAQMLAYALRDGTLGLTRDNRAAQQMVLEIDHALHHPRSVF